MDDHGEVLDAYTEALSLAGRIHKQVLNPENIYCMGIEQLAMGNTSEATHLLKKALPSGAAHGNERVLDATRKLIDEAIK
ncbi:MAG: hypothetical protein ACTSUE_04770 [Promethearchaeota archaeon]